MLKSGDQNWRSCCSKPSCVGEHHLQAGADFVNGANATLVVQRRGVEFNQPVADQHSAPSGRGRFQGMASHVAYQQWFVGVWQQKHDP